MKILRYVSFDGPFGKADPETFEEVGIPDAARVVAAALTAAEIPHSEPSNRGEWAYDFAAQVAKQRIEIIVASTDEDRPFVVSIEGQAGMLSGKAAKDALAVAHEAVCAAIHRQLSISEQITKLRWWTEAQWDTESGWTDAP